MLKTGLVAALLSAALMSAPAMAQEGGHAAIEKQSWTFAGPFGKFDKEQLQRGFQVYRTVCAACHSMRLLAFRNLEEKGGPEFTDGQVKALAAEYDIADSEAEGGTRKGVAADHWPSPFPSDADARAAFNGAVPPDLSVMAKARSVTDVFPNWVFNYFTGYSEGGPDYIHALMLGYRDEVPAGLTDNEGKPFSLPEGKYFNEVFPGHAISMPPPLADGVVPYAEGVPQTADQYARDVAAFLMWVAEPHLMERKEDGFRVILFLILFAGLMWFVKDRLWRPIHHHNPSADEVAHNTTAAPRRDVH
jgi:ubiquinol-cytochrome c reductase cytochrome c1 subunit